MNINQILVIAIIGVLLCAVLKNKTPQFSILISLIIGILIFLQILEPLNGLLLLLSETAEKAGVSQGYYGIILKIIGIAYISQFGAEICADAGEKAIATKVELAGKILIMATSAPVLTSLLELVLSLI